MQITKARAVELFKAMAFSAADGWNDARMQKKLDEIKDMADENTTIEDDGLAKLLRKALKADKIELVADDVEDAEEAATDGDAGEAEETDAGTDADADGDDAEEGEDEEEEEEEEPAPKPKKKGGSKKPAADGKKPAKKDKPAKKPKAAKVDKPKKTSMLTAAEQVMNDNGKPMTTQEIIMAMDEQGLWSSPNGKTPAATLYVRMLKEERSKGRQSRFTKTGPNQFALTKNVKAKK